MDGFVGRKRELAALASLLERVRGGGRTGRPGQAVLIRGRRRVGKSRLVEEFLAHAGVPYVYFTASAQPTAAELGLFTETVQESNLSDAREVFEHQRPSNWDAALLLLARSLPTDGPSVVVIDEMPYLMATNPGFEGTLQKIYDREFSRRPVLLIGIGSDLAMMEAVNEYGRPFHQRATEMVVSPLSPAEVATMLRLSAADAVDAYLVSGGLPLILDEWPRGASLDDYLPIAVARSTSALLVSGERALAAEFPPESQPRLLLSAIGTGERTYSHIARTAGVSAASVARGLQILTAKRVVEALTPLSTQPSRETRYIVADPHLRFWLAFLGPHLTEVERGRGDLVLARIRSGWSAWRGRAVEPVVRESLRRWPPAAVADRTGTVGGYWTRTNDVEVDLVGADRGPVARAITFVGSIKWQERRPFDAHDLARLINHRTGVPGTDDDTPLIVVSRSGSNVESVTSIGADEIVAAWEQ
jgi:AAA+ ATPase superfamily predicted ATPase